MKNLINSWTRTAPQLPPWSSQSVSARRPVELFSQAFYLTWPSTALAQNHRTIDYGSQQSPSNNIRSDLFSFRGLLHSRTSSKSVLAEFTIKPDAVLPGSFKRHGIRTPIWFPDRNWSFKNDEKFWGGGKKNPQNTCTASVLLFLNAIFFWRPQQRYAALRAARGLRGLYIIIYRAVHV